jgi:DNA-binding XRE family transcriptional regulator
MSSSIKPTNAEKLFLMRRRQGLSQLDMAKALGISPFAYGMLERGEVAVAQHSVSLSGPLSDAERCVLMRRRAGFTQKRVAKELGCSRAWVNKMERGEAKIDELLWYWEQ